MYNFEYKVQKGKIISERGLPVLPRWFTDDKLAIKFDKYGIDEIQYFNTTTRGSVNIFVSDLFGGIKFYIDDNGRKSYLKYTHTEVMPYGFVSTVLYDDCEFVFELRVVNNTVYIALTPVKVTKSGLKFAFEMYDSFRFYPPTKGDVRYRSGVPREWSEFVFENNTLSTSYTESVGGGNIAITSNDEIEYIRRLIEFKKNILLISGIESKTVSLAMGFEHDISLLKERIKEVLAVPSLEIQSQNDRYEKVREQIPVLVSNDENLNNFFTLAPLYHEALKLRNVSGAIRAKTNMYWVWDWDGMTNSEAYGYWGDTQFIGEMLKFYRDTADPVGGIAHAFNRDMKHGETCMVSAQGFYITLMYTFYKNGGDVKECFPFAKKIFDMIADVEVASLGLSRGMSLVPDFRDLILEDGNDISTFNNIVAYCAVRGIEEMAKGIGDTSTYEKAHAFAERTRKNFNSVLYDYDVGYYVSSANSITLEQRKTYMGMELKYENEFAEEILGETRNECLRFFEEKLICKAGINVFPLDNIAYDADANQAHCWFPAHSEYYSLAVNMANREDLMNQFIGWISSWTKYLLCPEGINCYADTDEPYLDNWNAAVGTWQAFAMRGWYNAIVHSIFGVYFDGKSIIFRPRSGEEMSISGLNIAGKKVDISMRGSGSKIKSIILDGVSIGSISKLDISLLKDHSSVVAERGEE